MEATDIAAIPNTRLVKQSMRLMGNRFEISVVTGNTLQARRAIDLAVQEIQRIENLLTTFKDDSETNRINANAGIVPVHVSSETLALIQRSLKISSLTQGAFDITYGAIDKRLWNFDQTMKALPDAATAKQAIRLINYRNVLVNEKDKTVFLKEKACALASVVLAKDMRRRKQSSCCKNWE